MLKFFWILHSSHVKSKDNTHAIFFLCERAGGKQGVLWECNFSSRQWRHCRRSSNWICPLWFCFLAVNAIVFYTAAVCVVTQRSLWPGKLRNVKNNGCVADYKCACFNYNRCNFTVILVSDSLLRVLGDCNHQSKWNYQVQASQYRFATTMFSFLFNVVHPLLKKD